MPRLRLGVPSNVMDQALGLAILIASLSLLWSVRRRLEFGSPAATVLTFLELLGLGIEVVSLGCWGIAVLGARSSDGGLKAP